MLGPKIHLKSIKNPSKNNIEKRLVFCLILCWLLLDFGSKLGGPGGSNEPAFRWLVGSWGQDSPKRPPRAPQEPPKSLQDPSKRAFGTDFGSIFDRFWMHFLTNVVWFLPLKYIHWIDGNTYLCWILGPSWPPKWLQNPSWRLSWGGSGGHLGPKSQQDRKSYQKDHKSITKLGPSWGSKPIKIGKRST